MPPFVQCTLLRCSLLSSSGPPGRAGRRDPLEAELVRATCSAQENSRWSRSKPRMLSKPVEVRYSRRPWIDDLVAMPQVRVAPGSEQPEVGRVGEELVARRDVDHLAIEGDAAQAAIPAAALPVDVGGVPVDGLPDLAPLEVDEVHATMAFALVAAADHRGGDQFHGRHSRTVAPARASPHRAAVTTSC